MAGTDVSYHKHYLTKSSVSQPSHNPPNLSLILVF